MIFTDGLPEFAVLFSTSKQIHLANSSLAQRLNHTVRVQRPQFPEQAARLVVCFQPAALCFVLFPFFSTQFPHLSTVLSLNKEKR